MTNDNINSDLCFIHFLCRSADRLTNDAFNIPEHAEGPVLRRASSDDTAASAGETSDDILAKYRKKPLAAEDKVDGLVDMEVEESRREQEEQDVPLHELDRDNLEVSFVFQDARRKLRLVLSEVELPVVQGGGEDREVVGLLEVRFSSVLNLLHYEVNLKDFHLQVMLAQALNQQDRNAAAQLRETLRCLSLFDQVPNLL